ncbi:MAG: elongation factor Ts [Candidatus Tokpelaia sp. JSC189]|nr:MAG: elongation factor Ts [Candidatus Tokpelaia sp. JSC189]
MSISAYQVKELRQITGAGIMDCKIALTETNSDMEAAVDWLRKRGIAKADKKAICIAAEGLISAISNGKKGVLVEVNSETDFVARNDTFQKIVRNIAQAALETDGSLEAVAAALYPGSSKTVADTIKDAVGIIGENISLRRVAMLDVKFGVVSTYIHNSVSDGLGKIGVLIAVETEGETESASAFGRQVAMHVAATNPLALTNSEVDPGAVEREKAIFFEQARQSGKPENIIEKMVEGRLRKFYKEVVLLSQAFVMNPDHSVESALREAEEKSIGAPAKLAGYVRFALGEGIEKKETDFAAEVATSVKG